MEIVSVGLSLKKQQRRKYVDFKGGSYPPGKQLCHAGRNLYVIET